MSRGDPRHDARCESAVKALTSNYSGRQKASFLSSIVLSRHTLRLVFSNLSDGSRKLFVPLRKLASMLTRLRAYQQETLPSHTKTLSDSTPADQYTPY